MDIRRFGPGHRRAEGPPGTRGLTGQVIWSDARAHISELAFSRQGLIAPHTNPNTTMFIVVSGGGWVQVGDERSRINHGEAVVWPAGVPAGAWTDGSEMRAVVVELPEPHPGLVLDGESARVSREHVVTPRATPAEGTLAERLPDPTDRDESEGEPW
ncbi:MAG: cupin domain-containing protein [Chloroflexi bacterium]|nr:cupin domain-containing protein [Chloroflexota bacterium]